MAADDLAPWWGVAVLERGSALSLGTADFPVTLVFRGNLVDDAGVGFVEFLGVEEGSEEGVTRAWEVGRLGVLPSSGLAGRLV